MENIWKEKQKMSSERKRESGAYQWIYFVGCDFPFGFSFTFSFFLSVSLSPRAVDFIIQNDLPEAPNW